MRNVDLEEILCVAKSTGADFSEIYLEDRTDTIIKDKSRSIQGVTSLHIHGAGIYLLRETDSVYVYTNDTSKSALLDLAKTAASLLPFVKKTQENHSIIFSLQKNPNLNPIEIYPRTVSAGQKIKIMKEMEHAAYSAGPVIQNLDVSYFDVTQHVIIANSEGLYTEDTRISTKIRFNGGVNWRGKICYDFFELVSPQGFEMFRQRDYVSWSQNTIRQMEDSLKVRPIKSCVVPVIFEAGDCGVFWHEACGHNLESGAAFGGIFAGKMGQEVASKKITLIDDGSIPGLNGSESMDDEGHSTQKNILIEHGILKSFLCDRKGGRMLGTGSTGSGRRQNYTFAPCSRMHNTYLEAGEDDEKEMISGIDKGILVTRLGGGSSGENFSIAVKEGFLIENGKITDRIGKFTLSGPSAQIIHRIDRVGKNVVKDLGGSFCGASSGLVPTTAYGPRFRVSAMSVGGTE